MKYSFFSPLGVTSAILFAHQGKIKILFNDVYSNDKIGPNTKRRPTQPKGMTLFIPQIRMYLINTELKYYICIYKQVFGSQQWNYFNYSINGTGAWSGKSGTCRQFPFSLTFSIVRTDYNYTYQLYTTRSNLVNIHNTEI